MKLDITEGERRLLLSHVNKQVRIVIDDKKAPVTKLTKLFQLQAKLVRCKGE